MARHTELNTRWEAQVALGDGLEAAAQVAHRFSWQGADTDRRQQRSLRSQAMVALALAWTDPLWRQRWRAKSGR